MKIVHISHLYHPSEGGVQFFFKNVSERLVKDYGDEVTVVTTNSYFGPERKIFKKIEPTEEFINGVKVLRFPYWRWHIHLYSFLFKVFVKLKIRKPEWMGMQATGPYSPSMKRYLMKATADAFCGSASNYYFMQLPLWKKCNFFYFGSIHLKEKEEEDALYKKQVESMNASTLYLANTTFETERLVKLGVKREKIFVLGAGVDMEPFLAVQPGEISAYRKLQSIPDDALVIGYAGRIEKTKNVMVVVRSFIRLAQNNKQIHLMIAGSGGDYAQELQAFCNNLPGEIKERIHWKINFPLEEKAPIFNSFDLLVLPSHNESFGIVFLEAWSCKKPVIGAAIGAVRHVINENNDGLLMEIDSEDSLVDKLTLLINDGQLRKKLGENGFNKVRDNFTWDIIVSKLRKCYTNANSNN